jgi:hypothetical protein
VKCELISHNGYVSQGLVREGLEILRLKPCSFGYFRQHYRPDLVPFIVFVVDAHCLRERLNRGWSVEKALNTPA